MRFITCYHLCKLIHIPDFFWIKKIIPYLPHFSGDFTMQSKQFYAIFPLEENYELCTSLSICILLKLTLTLYVLFCFVSLCLVLILNKGTRSATFFKGKNICEATSTRPNTTMVLFHFNNISYLLGTLIWANKVIRLRVYCPIRTFLAKILQQTLLMGCFVQAAAQEVAE